MPQYRLLIAQTKLLEVMITLDCKNYTNTPAVLEVWVLEVVPGLGQIGKELVKRQKCFLFSK